ncbi:unnamed protein product [Soboliphyme baturini]|uniref:ZP domain-containing protein n=1 Tax=Soboliphyme baturini TaxID=241478 RepID=A0A183IVE4_9BILA|nr:unnamed protein product [Soboliphyme baturini]
MADRPRLASVGDIGMARATVSVVVVVCWLLVVVPAFPAKLGYERYKKGNRGPFESQEIDFPEDRIIDLPAVVFPEPECNYAVRLVSPAGPVVRGVSIGDPLYHQWSCHTPDSHSELYCMVVRNCTVANNHVSYPIIDSDGCTLEPSIVPDVTYESDLNGGIYARAFSLGYSEPTLAFRCTINLLIKENGKCPRSDCSKLRH